MKTTVKRPIRDQEGNVLILVLVLLLVGGLILTPLLGLMSTGLMAGQVYEKKTAELYAADAGVEDAIWKIQNDKAEFDEDGSYSYPDPEQGVADLWVVNDRNVDVKIYRAEMPESTRCRRVYRHRILSTATSADGGATRIEAYLTATTEFLDVSGLMDHIITINENLTQKEIEKLENELKDNKVHFDCLERCQDCADPCGTVYDYNHIPEGCYGCGAVYNYDGWWPEPSVLSAYYLADVTGTPLYPSDPPDTLRVQDYPDGIGPLHRLGRLDIINTGAAGLTLKLNGTVYVTGNTTIGGNKDFTLDLNGKTIFVNSEHTKTEHNKIALKIEGKCIAIHGPGAIIAIGDIYFEPGVEIGTNGEPVFVFSVSGTTTVQPNASFYGSVAGDFYVEVHSGQGPEGPTFTYPPGGFGDFFDFPSLVEVDRTYHIASWTIGPA